MVHQSRPQTLCCPDAVTEGTKAGMSLILAKSGWFLGQRLRGDP